MEAIQEPNVVWLSGNSGAGKTFTADYLEVYHNFVHINGDEGYASPDPEKKRCFDLCIKAFQCWFQDKEAPEDLWHPHFELLIKQIQEAQKTGKHVVVSFTVYHRQVRDFLRKNLPKFIYIQFSCSPDVLIQRAWKRFQEYAKGIGKDVETAFMDLNKIKYTPENFEMLAKSIMKGLMDLEKDELETGFSHSLNVDDGVTYMGKLHDLLQLGPFDGSLPVETIAQINYDRFKKLKK